MFMCVCSVSGGCPVGKEPPRGKVPVRSMYLASEQHQISESSLQSYGLTDQRIIPGGPDACIDSRTASGYLNKPEVMAAIHVRDPGYCWSVCSSAQGWYVCVV